MSGLIQHKSGIFWFRLGVPERFRSAIGTTEIKASLRTRDKAVALVLHAAKLRESKELFAKLDAEQQANVGDEAARICRSGFAELARRNLARHDDGVTSLADAESNVVLAMWTVLAHRARCTWGTDHAWRADQELGLESSSGEYPAVAPAAISDHDDQAAFVGRVQLLEAKPVEFVSTHGVMLTLAGNPQSRGMAYREIAIALLERRDSTFIELEVMMVAEAAQALVTPRTRLFEALAEKVLEKLATHRPAAWVDNPWPSRSPVTAHSAAAEVQTGETNYKLEDAFKLWCKKKRLKPTDVNKTKAEWELARDRFIELHGDLPLRAITRSMIKHFRDTLLDLPSRPKRAIKALPLAKQIDVAAAKNLKLLEPPTVKKQLAAISSMLALALDEDWIERNVAADVDVEGSGYVGDERSHFTAEELKLIFSSPLGTDPDACSDTMFYLLVLASLHGGRPGEYCKLKPSELCIEDGSPVMRIRRTQKRRQKTTSSIRDVPIHWIAEEAGILTFAELKRRAGAEWLFDDLVADKYGDRYKLMSRKINRALRAIGITDPDKSFYSMRHSSKREARRRGMSEERSDQLHGHAGSTGRKYGQGTPTDVLKIDVDEQTFDSVDWDPVVACGKARVARAKKHLGLELG